MISKAASSKALPIAVAYGDGIGKEIMTQTLRIFSAAHVPLSYNFVDMGKSIYLAGNSTGMTPEAQKTVESLGILYKGPMETPKGTGVKSINVTARKVWSTFANKRVFRSVPGVSTVFSEAGIPINLTLVRENIEDTYGGIEHMQSNDVAQCRRLITRPGCLQVHQYAFEVARQKGAKRVTCAHKANIMKLTDGLFLETFRQVASQYPDIHSDDVIIDDMAMKMVATPDKFDVIVLPNLQGDILSDLCAGLVGGLGMAPSANIGERIQIFEAVHGTAPDIAGKNLANPTALLMSGIMMLRHLKLNHKATQIENALLDTLSAGYRTRDLAKTQKGDRLCSTSEFADAIISNLTPEAKDPAADHGVPVYTPPTMPDANIVMKSAGRNLSSEVILGGDIFVDSDLGPVELAKHLKSNIATAPVELVMISNRGTQVWPTGSLFTECVNHYRARFENVSGEAVPIGDLLDLAKRIGKAPGDNGTDGHVRFCSMETLLKIGKKKGYSLAQGQ